MLAVKAGEVYDFEVETFFDEHRYLHATRAGEYKLRRGSDGFYWNGTTFASGLVWNATTANTTDPLDPFHKVTFTIPPAAADGDTYALTVRLPNDKLTERTLNLIVRVALAGMTAHQHIGEFDFDLPIGDRS